MTVSEAERHIAPGLSHRLFLGVLVTVAVFSSEWCACDKPACGTHLSNASYRIDHCQPQL